MYIVYVLHSKSLANPGGAREAHIASRAFTSCLRVKHFSPPPLKKAGKINPTHHPQQFMKLQFEKGAGYLI